VAVLPFETLGGESAGGRIVSERLIPPLVNSGLEVVERSLLESVMREQKLRLSGLVSASSVRELGRILDVTAVVTGTVTVLKDDRVEINARLIDTQTAQVISASVARVEKDWSEEPSRSIAGDGSWSSLIPPMPSLDAAQNAWGGTFDEGPTPESDCQRSQEASDELERAMVDYKARYWAQRMRQGLTADQLKRNPGSEIGNPEIRAQFYARLKFRMQNPGGDLTDAERARVRDMLESQQRLASSCRSDS
jgi:TolB-like protein